MSEKILSIKVRIYNLNGSLVAFLLCATNEPGCRKTRLVFEATFWSFCDLKCQLFSSDFFTWGRVVCVQGYS